MSHLGAPHLVPVAKSVPLTFNVLFFPSDKTMEPSNPGTASQLPP
jgi:hypothetical protein